MRWFLAVVFLTTMTFGSGDGTLAEDNGVESVLASAASALGAQHLDDIRTIDSVATGTEFGLPATSQAYTDMTAGGANSNYTQVSGFNTDSGYDGKSAWTRDSAGVVWVDGSQQGHAAAVNEAYRESYTLWKASHGGAQVLLLPPQSQGGRHFNVVRVTAPGSVIPFEVWIDQTTHLPARYVELAATVTTTTLLSNYHAVNGVEWPFSIHQTSDQGNETQWKVTRVDVAPADFAAKIRKPDSDVHDSSIASGDQTSIPFDLVDNHVYLNVMLNGKGPYPFIFDTGGQNLIDPVVLREIGASAIGNAQGSGVGAATEQFSFAHVASLRVGDAELRNQLFVVVPVRAGFGVSGSAPVDGLIGAEVLARFVTVFDYANSRITLERPGTALTGTNIPFVFNGTQPQIPCQIDLISTQCAIDSGSRSSLDLFAPFIADNAAVVPTGVTAPGVNGFGIGGPDIGRLGRLSSLKIADFDLPNLVGGFSAATAGAFAVPGVGANIGGGVLKRFTVTYDYEHQMMSLAPNSALDEPDSYERSGLFVVNVGKFAVAGVRAGTPAAAAGIVKGDTIVSLDGVPATQLTLGNLRKQFRLATGTQLQIGVLSKGATSPRMVTVTLRDYV